MRLKLLSTDFFAHSQCFGQLFWTRIMQCPACQHHKNRILESRSTEGGKSVRRRRECLECKHRFTTYERIEFVPIIVIKRDGSRESFDRSKLLRGLIRACEKTRISHQRLETFVDEIEAQLQQRSLREVITREIGELVLGYLRQENEVAYIRFASVYRQFQGITDFIETLNQLQSQPKNSQKTEEWQECDRHAPSEIATSSSSS